MKNCAKQRTCDNKGISSLHIFYTLFRSKNGSLYCGSIFDPPSKRKKSPQTLRLAGTSGAGNVTRTHDLLITNQLLYRLSYASICQTT